MNALMSILSTVAPTVASAFLGPLGGVAVAAIGKIIGVDNATVQTVSKAFEDGKITPEQLAEIKKLELQYQNDEKERGFKYAELEYKNTDSARNMQVVTHSTFPAMLSGGITIGFFGVLAWMLYDPAVVNSPPLLIMLGSLGAAFGAVVNFWLGSTKESANKNILLAQSVPK